MGENYKKYMYDGPVMEYNDCLIRRMIAYTKAPTADKAKSNIAYRFKIKNGMLPTTKIKLPGKITLVEDNRIDDGEQLSFL